MAVIELPFLEHATALEFMKKIGECFVERFDLNAVENLPHLGIAGNMPDTEELINRLLVTSFLKAEQRRFLQGKHRQGRGERVGH